MYIAEGRFGTSVAEYFLPHDVHKNFYLWRFGHPLIDFVNNTCEEYNAEENNIPLIPFMLNDIALNKELMLNDGIHPNATAQPLIAEFLYTNLLPLMSEVD